MRITVELTNDQISLMFFLYGFAYEMLTDRQKKEIEKVLVQLTKGD